MPEFGKFSPDHMPKQPTNFEKWQMNVMSMFAELMEQVETNRQVMRIYFDSMIALAQAMGVAPEKWTEAKNDPQSIDSYFKQLIQSDKDFAKSMQEKNEKLKSMLDEHKIDETSDPLVKYQPEPDVDDESKPEQHEITTKEAGQQTPSPQGD